MPGGYGKIVATEPADAKIRPILIRLLHQECSTIQPLQVFGPQRGLFYDFPLGEFLSIVGSVLHCFRYVSFAAYLFFRFFNFFSFFYCFRS